MKNAAASHDRGGEPNPYLDESIKLLNLTKRPS